MRICTATRSASRRPGWTRSREPERRGNAEMAYLSPCRRVPVFLLLQAWIQRIAQAITEHVEAEDGEENGQTGEDGDPRVVLNEHYIRPQIPAPARGWRLRA